MVCERSLEHWNDVYICFVDFEKAFDRVNWIKMIDTEGFGDRLERQKNDSSTLHESKCCDESSRWRLGARSDW